MQVGRAAEGGLRKESSEESQAGRLRRERNPLTMSQFLLGSVVTNNRGLKVPPVTGAVPFKVSRRDAGS